jgi:hypothetical protein
VGVAILGWRISHNEAVTLQNGSTTAISGAEVLIIAGGLIALMAFLPSSGTVGRWMSLKRRKPAPHTQFRRRHR